MIQRSTSTSYEKYPWESIMAVLTLKSAIIDIIFLEESTFMLQKIIGGKAWDLGSGDR